MAGYPHPQGDTLYVSPTLTKIMQYSQAAPSFAFHLFNQVAQPLAGKECFIYFRFFSHKFVSASLKEPCGFFPMVFDRNPTHFVHLVIF